MIELCLKLSEAEASLLHTFAFASAQNAVQREPKNEEERVKLELLKELLDSISNQLAEQINE